MVDCKFERTVGMVDDADADITSCLSNVQGGFGGWEGLGADWSFFSCFLFLVSRRQAYLRFTGR
jgi:hypothetical protein